MSSYPALNKALVIDPSGELRDFLRFCRIPDRLGGRAARLVFELEKSDVVPIIAPSDTGLRNGRAA